MKKKPAAISAEVFSLLKLAEQAVRDAHIEKYAIGGAVGMAAHGYARHTADVDLFVDPQSKNSVLRSMRKLGLHVWSVFEGIHYVAQIPETEDPELRIDVLFPHDDPDWSAVQAPELGMLGNLQINVFPIELLVLSKFYASQDDPQDKADIHSMYHRGLFDPDEVRKLLVHMDKALLPEWDALLVEFQRPRTQRRGPRRN